jgi:hypothetical protein
MEGNSSTTFTLSLTSPRQRRVFDFQGRGDDILRFAQNETLSIEKREQCSRILSSWLAIKDKTKN